MPNIMNITRGATAPTLTRSSVPFGMVFANRKRNGSLGTKYAALGHNGRIYSFNVDSGELASSPTDAGREVVACGRWEFTPVNRTFALNQNRIGMQVRRSEVQPGEVFTVNGKASEYYHVGRIDHDKNGWLSVRLGATDHAVTRNGDTNVTIVGTAQVQVTLAR